MKRLSAAIVVGIIFTVSAITLSEPATQLPVQDDEIPAILANAAEKPGEEHAPGAFRIRLIEPRIEKLTHGWRTKFTADGKWAVVDGHVVNAKKGVYVRRPPVTYPELNALLPDGKTIAFSVSGYRAAGSIEKFYAVQFYDLESGKLTRTLDGVIGRLVFSPDAKRFYAIEYDRLHVWDLTEGKLLRTMNIPPNPPISPDGRYYAALRTCDPPRNAINLKKLRVLTTQPVLYSVSDGKEVKRFEPVEGNCRKVDFTRDGKYLVTDGAGPIVWNVATGKLVEPAAEMKAKKVFVPAHTVGGRYLLCVDESFEFNEFFDLKTRRAVPVVKADAHKCLITGIAPDGRRAIVMHYDPAVRSRTTTMWFADLIPVRPVEQSKE